jgi:hypothetical protein
MRSALTPLPHVRPGGSLLLVASCGSYGFHKKSAAPTKGLPQTVLARILLLTACLICAVSAHAATWYVNKSATGANTGADWNNAWTALQSVNWANIQPGDAIYVAGGHYTGELTIAKSGTSSAPIRFFRATKADPNASGAPGWQDSYDSAVIQDNPGTGNDGIYFPGGVGNWIVIDGIVDRGWQIQFATTGTAGSGVEIDQAAVSNVIFRHIYVNQPQWVNQTSDMRGFDLTPTSGLMQNITLQHCEVNRMSEGLTITLANNALVEYCSFHDQGNLNQATVHPNVIYAGAVNNSTFRYNKLYNITVEGLFFNDPNTSNNLVYGNLFYQGDIGAQSGARALEWKQAGNSGYKVYNNTFVGLPIGIQGNVSGATFSGCFFRNNIVWKMTSNFGSGWTIDHNYVSRSDPFVNSAAFDYHLKSGSPAIGIGLNLGSDYAMDIGGVVRTGTTWDAGAYAFVATPTQQSYSFANADTKPNADSYASANSISQPLLWSSTSHPAGRVGRELPMEGLERHSRMEQRLGSDASD